MFSANYCELDEAYTVSIKELKKFGNENHVQISMISAKHNIGIKEMFSAAAKKYLSLIGIDFKEENNTETVKLDKNKNKKKKDKKDDKDGCC